MLPHLLILDILIASKAHVASGMTMFPIPEMREINEMPWLLCQIFALSLTALRPHTSLQAFTLGCSFDLLTWRILKSSSSAEVMGTLYD